jgi:hypothetical protein
MGIPTPTRNRIFFLAIAPTKLVLATVSLACPHAPPAAATAAVSHVLALATASVVSHVRVGAHRRRGLAGAEARAPHGRPA